jgi:large repetitive protein
MVAFAGRFRRSGASDWRPAVILAAVAATLLTAPAAGASCPKYLGSPPENLFASAAAEAAPFVAGVLPDKDEAPPVVTKVTPYKGPASGETTVTVEGSGFIGATAVEFGTTPAASFTVDSTREITAVSPPGAGTVYVIVTTPYGTSRPECFTGEFHYGAPSVTGVSPNTGVTSGGTSVVVTGIGFATGTDVTAFKFGKVLASEVSCSSTVTCTVVTPPATKKGTVDVKAIVDKKASKKNRPADQFSYD